MSKKPNKKSGLNRFFFCSSLSSSLLLAFLSSAPVATGQEITGPVRERISLNNDWRFQKDDPAEVRGGLNYERIKPWILPARNAFTKDPASHAKRPDGNPGDDVSYVQPGFDDRAWRRLDLPHDWAIEGPFNMDLPGNTAKLPYVGVGWYRKHFQIPAQDAGKRVFLQIDGAMSYSSVWCNGKFVGGWPYGYSSYQLDLTPYIKVGGENVLAIRLENPPDSARWYPGAGIYRNVWLLKTSPVHVAQWGTSITTPEITGKSAAVRIQADISNQSETPAAVSVITSIFDGSALVATAREQTATLAPGQTGQTVATVAVPKPQLWDLHSPHLYHAVTKVLVDGKVEDEYQTPFGIRSIQFVADKGFFLNGKRIEIQGVCNHHDLGALGAAFNIRAAERQLEIMKEMGVNALRTSHNMPAPELLDLCDRMGILVMDESFDCWKKGKNKNDYNLLWDDWHEADLRAEIRRDRNHPSVFMWSIGNEVLELTDAVAGPAIAAELTAIGHEEDPTRPTTLGSHRSAANSNGIAKGVDVMGLNYQSGNYAGFRELNPTIPVIASETSSCLSSRGEYFFPVSEEKTKGFFDFQVSSYDIYSAEWAYRPDQGFAALDKNPFVGGEFVWTGFDYLGEPTPYNKDVTNLLNFETEAGRAEMQRQLNELGKIQVPSRSSYFGIVDLAGFKKDRFYLYQSRWRPDLPMVHILPHWNWPGREGQATPVHVYTSGDEAELFLNGQSLGRKKKEPHQYRLRWDDVVYAPGELKAVAYKNGRQWAESFMKTTGPAAKLTMQADRSKITADGKDLSFVKVTIADKNGQLVPRSKNLMKFEISGPGEIVAVDNGDATSFEPFQASERKAYNGLALVIVRTKPGQSGEITLRARSEGLEAAEVKIAGELDRVADRPSY